MTKVRKLSLAEWFLHYQLGYCWKNYHHLPEYLDCDVTGLVSATEEAGLRFSPTAAVVKACAMLLEKRPKLNRMLFHTLFGLRMLELDSNRVNLPVIIHNQGSPVLSAMVIQDAHKKSVSAIHSEIREFSKTDLTDKPIGRFVASHRNWWWNRMVLRGIHFIAHRVPQAYASKGGGISVSSLMRRNVQGLVLRGMAFGQTALTVCVTGLHKGSDGRFTMNLGLDCNHSVLEGDEFSELAMLLGEMLSTDDAGVFYDEMGDGAGS